jgi:hypothetical protein
MILLFKWNQKNILKLKARNVKDLFKHKFVDGITKQL